MIKIYGNLLLRLRFDLFSDRDGFPNRSECDDLARSLPGGEPVVPFAIQGQFSYTHGVLSPKLSQKSDALVRKAANPRRMRRSCDLCLNNSKIDIHAAQLAEALHRGIAAEMNSVGEIGLGAGTCVGVYVIEKLPGRTNIEMGNFFPSN